MTYVAGFYCEGGIVLCTDTQETVGDQKRDIEKLYVSDEYPLAVGGAGIDEAMDAFAQEVIERVEHERPLTIPELKALVNAALSEVLEHDAPMSGWPQEYKKAQYIVAAWPNHDKPVIFRIRGRRVYQVKDHVIIGYETAPNYLLLKRMYDKNLPMVQAVMLAIYLVSQSKQLDAFVGGETRIAVVGDRAEIDYPEYIKNAEARIADFVKLIDKLFLLCVDPSIPPSGFPAVVEAFAKDLTQLRQNWLHQSATIWFNRALADPTGYSGEPYAKIFSGAVMSVTGDGNVSVSEELTESKEKRLEMMREAERQKEEWRSAHEKLKELTQGRKPLYEGRERVLLRPHRELNIRPDL